MFRLLALFMFILPCALFSQDINQLLKEAQQQEFSFHENEAFLKYAEILKLEPANLVALCKCSELSCRIGARQPTKDKMHPYFTAGKNYAATAYRLYPNSSSANFAMSLSIGRVSLVGTNRERVEMARDVRTYAENAVRLDPNNFGAYHILGRWNYEVNNLNLAEKTFAKVLYGGLPKASIQQAIYYYEKSRSIDPAFLLNYLELARTYHHMDDDRKAVAYLRILLNLPNRMYDDMRVKVQAKQMLSEWQ